MELNKSKCKYACIDVDIVNIVKYFPQVYIDTDSIKLIMISKALPRNINDYFYQPGNPMFLHTTNQAFSDAGYNFKSIDDYLKSGIYLTTVIKCQIKDYLGATQTLKNYSPLLQKEIEQFNDVKVIMCMGDFAIKSINYIYKN